MSIELCLWCYWAQYHLFFIVRDDIRSWCLIVQIVEGYVDFLCLLAQLHGNHTHTTVQLMNSFWKNDNTMDRCKCYLLFSHFPISMGNSKVAAWKSCQTQYLTTIYNLKRHFKLRALVCGCYHFQKILIWMLCSKCWVCYEAYCSHSFFLFHTWPLYRANSWKNAIYNFWLQKGVKNSTW